METSQFHIVSDLEKFHSFTFISDLVKVHFRPGKVSQFHIVSDLEKAFLDPEKSHRFTLYQTGKSFILGWKLHSFNSEPGKLKI